MTYRELLKHTQDLLNKAGITSAQIDARILMEYCFSLSREALVLKDQETVTPSDIERYMQLVMRRAHFEPVSKITGVREFYNLSFAVTIDTLDPRPDSETLIDAVFEYFPNKKQTLRFLDLGTGSGCLILTLLFHYENAHGMAVDISAAALTKAFMNAVHLDDLKPNLKNRLDLVQTNWTLGLLDEGTFDIIVSNPPYIPTQDIQTLDPDVRLYDPHLALDGGEDGMTCYDAILKDAAELLNPQGFLFLEIGQGQEDSVTNRALENGFQLIDWKKDMNGIKRCGVFQKA